ncbi:hypothetical protein [Fimbriiglobus ruber]|uniref:Uncharacterized protein n=1 Tax=Fimbriiglobus ruber TaxID=1908690 RepID=A0A225D489_9BACT|nr:hypothetical protein [Fimbriiglobus ruber]OWK36312.1 hypothetical protein FRUB_08875 [Fimbriiglobus ruber]
MLATPTLTEERMSADLEAEVRPLIGSLRTALVGVMAASGTDSVSRFLSDAPVEACVRLADVWAVATAIGVPTDQVKARFSPEEQFLIEIVTSVYSAARPTQNFGDLPELARLLDETGWDVEDEAVI